MKLFKLLLLFAFISLLSAGKSKKSNGYLQPSPSKKPNGQKPSPSKKPWSKPNKSPTPKPAKKPNKSPTTKKTKPSKKPWSKPSKAPTKKPGSCATGCHDQDQCLEVTSIKAEGDKYKICIDWNSKKKDCKKSSADTFEQICNKHGYGKSGSLNKGCKEKELICETVDCGDYARFAVRDKSSCKGSGGVFTLNGVEGVLCEVGDKDDMCDSKCFDSCVWKVPAPKCTTTPKPTTANPTSSAPTSAAPTTANPTSASPTSAAPTTSNPTSAAPTSASPTSAAPTTSSPTSAAPTTSSPTSAAPTSAAPTSASPTSASPTSASPTTSNPTSAAPTTAGPTSAAPTSAAPTTSSPTTSSPTSAAPTTSSPTSAAPTTAGPTSAAPTTSNPTSAAPTSAAPTSSAPTTSNPTSAAPTSAAPTTSSPTTASPTTANPTSAAPTSASPTTSSPTTSAPTSAAPTSAAPTTSAPTTSAPTTSAPTTSAPTSAAPTSAAPTTSSPTTASPTTSAPTSAAPTTSSPTTASPTSAAPTTASPTTAEPTPVQCIPEFDGNNICGRQNEQFDCENGEGFTGCIWSTDLSPPKCVRECSYALEICEACGGCVVLTDSSGNRICSKPPPPTASPTTAAPTSAAPTTASPTTAAPTVTQCIPEPNPNSICGRQGSELFCLNTEGGGCEWTTALDPNGQCVDVCSYGLETCEACGCELVNGERCQERQSPTTAAPIPAPTTAQPSPEPTRSPLQPGNTFSPSPEPTRPPTFPKCETEDKLDIAFLMDESGSVDAQEWDELKDFVKTIIAQDVAQDSYVAMWEYASYPAWNQFAEWSLVRDRANYLERSLTNNRHSVAGLTYTWDAVNRVLDSFFNYTLECDNGCETRPDILFLLTDGVPTDTVCPDMTARMSQSDVDIVVIIIGAALIEDNVACLDVNDGGADVYRIERFGPAELNALEEKVRAKTCTGQFENPEGERPDPADRWVYADGSTGLGPIPNGGEGSGNGCAPNCDDTPAPNTPLLQSGNSGSASAMTQGESSLQNPDANAFNGTVTSGLYIGAAAVIVVALIGAGSYFAFKKAVAKERFVNNVMNSMKDVTIDGDSTSIEIGQSIDLEMDVISATSVTGFAE